MEKMHLLFAWLFCLSASADSTLTAPREISVYQGPESDAKVLFHIRKGEKIRTGTETGGYIRVQVKRGGKFYGGFADEIELESHEAETWSGDQIFSGRVFGFGGGAEYTYLRQGGKSFQTTDQVMYTTSTYVSTMAAPFISIQMGHENFWRLSGALKRTHYTGSASTNIVGAVKQDVILEQTFFSGLLQHAWTMASGFYGGAGVELAKATSVKLSLGGQELPTTSSDLPIYFGFQGFGGYAGNFSKTLSWFGEARVEAILNQSPTIYSIEATLGFLYWP
jgi:hypothetical protein